MNNNFLNNTFIFKGFNSQKNDYFYAIGKLRKDFKFLIFKNSWTGFKNYENIGENDIKFKLLNQFLNNNLIIKDFDNNRYLFKEDVLLNTCSLAAKFIFGDSSYKLNGFKRWKDKETDIYLNFFIQKNKRENIKEEINNFSNKNIKKPKKTFFNNYFFIKEKELDIKLKFFYKDLSYFLPLSKEYEYKCFDILRNSKLKNIKRKIRNILLKSNIKLVISICKKFSTNNITFEDLKKDGELGLLKSIDNFDYKRGFRFSTFATWWIRQAVTRSIADKDRIIRIPVHMLESYRKLFAIKKRLIKENNEKLEYQEIQKLMGNNFSIEKIRKIEKNSPLNEIILNNVEFDKYCISNKHISIDKQVNKINFFNVFEKMIKQFLTIKEQKIIRFRLGKPPITIKDLLELVENSRSIKRLRLSKEWNEIKSSDKLVDVILKLDKKDPLFKEISKYEFKPLTLDKTSKKLRITRERVRQIETKAYKKIINHKKWLYDFVFD